MTYEISLVYFNLTGTDPVERLEQASMPEINEHMITGAFFDAAHDMISGLKVPYFALFVPYLFCPHHLCSIYY